MPISFEDLRRLANVGESEFNAMLAKLEALAFANPIWIKAVDESTKADESSAMYALLQYKHAPRFFDGERHRTDNDVPLPYFEASKLATGTAIPTSYTQELDTKLEDAITRALVETDKQKQNLAFAEVRWLSETRNIYWAITEGSYDDECKDDELRREIIACKGDVNEEVKKLVKLLKRVDGKLSWHPVGRLCQNLDAGMIKSAFPPFRQDNSKRLFSILTIPTPKVTSPIRGFWKFLTDLFGLRGINWFEKLRLLKPEKAAGFKMAINAPDTFNLIFIGPKKNGKTQLTLDFAASIYEFEQAENVDAYNAALLDRLNVNEDRQDSNKLYELAKWDIAESGKPLLAKFTVPKLNSEMRHVLLADTLGEYFSLKSSSDNKNDKPTQTLAKLASAWHGIVTAVALGDGGTLGTLEVLSSFIQSVVNESSTCVPPMLLVVTRAENYLLNSKSLLFYEEPFWQQGAIDIGLGSNDSISKRAEMVFRLEEVKKLNINTFENASSDDQAKVRQNALWLGIEGNEELLVAIAQRFEQRFLDCVSNFPSGVQILVTGKEDADKHLFGYKDMIKSFLGEKLDARESRKWHSYVSHGLRQ